MEIRIVAHVIQLWRWAAEGSASGRACATRFFPFPLSSQAWRPSTPPDNQEGGFRAQHARHTRADAPTRDRVAGAYPGFLSRACHGARHGAVVALLSLQPPPTPQKPQTTAAHAAGNTAQAPHDARDPAAHTRTPAAQTLPSGSRVAFTNASKGARERRRTRPRARGAWRISRDDRETPEVRAVPRTSHRAPEGAETARVPLHRRYRRFFVTFQNKMTWNLFYHF